MNLASKLWLVAAALLSMSLGCGPEAPPPLEPTPPPEEQAPRGKPEVACAGDWGAEALADFGSTIDVKKPLELDCTLRNAGDAPLTLHALSATPEGSVGHIGAPDPSAPFQVFLYSPATPPGGVSSPLPLVVAPAAEAPAHVRVRFQPWLVRLGVHEATVSLQVWGLEPVTLHLRGEVREEVPKGRLWLQLPEHDFGELPLGTSREVPVKALCTAEPCVMRALQLVNDTVEDAFSLVGVEPMPRTIRLGEEVVVGTLRVTRTQQALARASVSASVEEVTESVDLSSVRVGPPTVLHCLSVSPTVLDLGERCSDGSANVSLFNNCPSEEMALTSFSLEPSQEGMPREGCEGPAACHPFSYGFFAPSPTQSEPFWLPYAHAALTVSVRFSYREGPQQATFVVTARAFDERPYRFEVPVTAVGVVDACP